MPASSRRTRHVQAAHLAVFHALQAHARGDIEYEEVERLKEIERAVERNSRRAGAWPIKDRPGFYRFDCSRCGRRVEAYEDDLPVPFSKGFRPAGRCSECRGEGANP